MLSGRGGPASARKGAGVDLRTSSGEKLMGITRLLVCTALASAVSARPTVAQDPPNVLFISIDDLNDWVGVLGGYPDVQTPHLDSLAQRGTLFTNAHCSSPRCNPSRVSLMSGLHPATCGVRNNSIPWRYSMLEVITLPQHFMTHGYEVLASGKLYHHTIRDFASWHEYVLPPYSPAPAEYPANGIEGLSYNLDYCAMDVPDSEMQENRVALWASSYLSQEHDEPFFLAVGFFKPHGPLYIPAPYFDMYPLADIVLPSVIPGDLDDVPPPGVALAEITA